MPDPGARVSFGAVRELGPSLTDRVAGSPALRRRQWVGRMLSRGLADIHVDGLDRVPSAGPVILAVNHTTFLDGPLLFGLIPRPVSFLVKAEAFQPLGGLPGVILRDAAQLPVRRFQIDPGPIRYALQLLDRGGVLGMFPEGTRGDGLVERIRPGVGYLAVRSGAPVLPVALVGVRGMVRQLGRTPVSVRFGAPIHFEPVPTPAPRSSWLTAAEVIRTALAELVRDALSSSPGRAARMEA